METSYRELKCKFVVNVTDGRNLGKTCDIVFSYPEGKVFGIVVPGKRGLRLFHGNDLFISIKSIVKIGADVVLVDLKNTKPEGRPNKKHPFVCEPAEGQAYGRRDYAEYD